jgi:hypothetical protein
MYDITPNRPHRGKNQRQRGKSDEQRRVEALVQGRFAEQLVHGEHIGDGQITVHLRDDALYRKSELLEIMAGANHKRADGSRRRHRAGNIAPVVVPRRLRSGYRPQSPQ